MKMLSLFGKISERARLAVLGRKLRGVLHMEREPDEIRDYYYIRYALGVLRVVAWVVLVIGVIGSVIWAMTANGMGGAGRMLLGMVGSFLAWLLLIAARELLQLFVDVKENTRKTAKTVLKE